MPPHTTLLWGILEVTLGRRKSQGDRSSNPMGASPAALAFSPFLFPSLPGSSHPQQHGQEAELVSWVLETAGIFGTTPTPPHSRIVLGRVCTARNGPPTGMWVGVVRLTRQFEQKACTLVVGLRLLRLGLPFCPPFP